MRHDDRQLVLFGDPRPWRVGPAPIDPQQAALAREMPREIRLGTSSWSFPGWAGIVWDREASATDLARHGLPAYARHPLLRAVGIDRTYYAPLTAGELATYAGAVPADFRFLVKAASTCTDPWARDETGRIGGENPRFLDPEFAAAEVVEPFAAGLGERGGPLVFQFPPLGRVWTATPWRFAETLGAFLSALPRGPLYAVELRDRALLTRDYVEVLRRAGATHCLTVHPRMPGLLEQRTRIAVLADRPLVVRWMLAPHLDYNAARERYAPFSRIVDEDPATRSILADLCRDHARRRVPAFVIANNKAEGSAPLTLFRLAAAIVG